jgi:phosphatidate cytidylyltransferase
MLRWRLLLGAALIAALVGLCWLDHRACLPGTWLMPVVAILTVLATGEIIEFLAAAQMRPVSWIVHLGNLLLLAGNWLPVLLAGQQGTAEGALAGCLKGCSLVLALAVLALFLGEMRRYEKPGGATANLAAGVFALVYVGLLFSFVVQLRLAWGIGALASLLIVVKMGDTGAYTVGRLFGRHKMAPVLSPGKTVEGAVGALAFSLVGAWATPRWLLPLTGVGPRIVAEGHPPWWGWIVFGLLVGAAGMAGDLAESLLKRDARRKDSSSWMPGFGGVLDLLDSVLVAAPVAYACWALGLMGV